MSIHNFLKQIKDYLAGTGSSEPFVVKTIGEAYPNP